MNHIPNNAKYYMSSVLLYDHKVEDHMKTLAHLQAAVMRSLQVRHRKRAVKYALAFYATVKNNPLSEADLADVITEKLLS